LSVRSMSRIARLVGRRRLVRRERGRSLRARPYGVTTSDEQPTTRLFGDQVMALKLEYRALERP
jgi:hypothetical protein